MCLHRKYKQSGLKIIHYPTFLNIHNAWKMTVNLCRHAQACKGVETDNQKVELFKFTSQWRGHKELELRRCRIYAQVHLGGFVHLLTWSDLALRWGKQVLIKRRPLAKVGYTRRQAVNRTAERTKGDRQALIGRAKILHLVPDNRIFL